MQNAEIRFFAFGANSTPFELKLLNNSRHNKYNPIKTPIIPGAVGTNITQQ